MTEDKIIEKENLNQCKKYPFIEELVDKLYTESLNELIENNVSSPIDKKVFLMYITMYFIIHLQIEENKDNDNQNKKELIKSMLNDLISNKDKRKMFIEFFGEKFQEIEFTQDTVKLIDDNLDNLLEE